MKNYLTISFSGAALFLVSCSCLNFNDLSSGANYNVGDVLTTSGTTFLVEKFQWGNLNWTSDGELTVTPGNKAGGSGPELNTNNVNLNFQIDYPVNEITLRFADYGGNSNVRINGALKNVNDIMSLNNSTISGVTVTISGNVTGGNWVGSIKLEGIISDFAIGGQEFWIDDICWQK